MTWLLLVIVALLGLLMWIVRAASGPYRATLQEERRTSPSHSAPAASASRLQITVDGLEHDYTHHPLFQAIAPAMAQGDWAGARRYLQKIAYGIKSATEQEQREFKHIMMAFAAVDPLYAQCLRAIAPILAEHPQGVRQTALYPHMAAAPDAETARYVLYFADELGAIRRHKKGNSYTVFAASGGPEVDFRAAR